MCDDDCPFCGARHMTPYKSDDWTVVIEKEGDKFVALCSPETAEYDPDYGASGTFPTRAEAKAYLASR